MHEASRWFHDFLGLLFYANKQTRLGQAIEEMASPLVILNPNSYLCRSYKSLFHSNVTLVCFDGCLFPDMFRFVGTILNGP